MAFTTITADGNFSLAGVVDEVTRWNGGIGSMSPSGGFGGGTIKLQADFGDGFVDVGSDVEFTEAGVNNFELPACDLQFNVAGSTTPTLVVRTPEIN